MEVMFHDMERTLGKRVALPCKDARLQESYTFQLIDANEGAVETDDADEAIDLHGGSGTSSPVNIDDNIAADFAVGEQFVMDDHHPHHHHHHQHDPAASTTLSTAGTSEFDMLEGPSSATSADGREREEVETDNEKAMGKLRLEDVAERWQRSQAQKVCVRREGPAGVKEGVKAEGMKA